MVHESHYEKLRDAIFDDDVDRFQGLLETSIEIDHYDAGGQTLLHLASFWGRTSMVRMLLSAGASMRCKNAAGCTALDLAIHWGHSSVAEVLRHRGASSVWEDKLGQLQIEVEDEKTRNQQLSQEIAQHKLQRVEMQEEMMALYQRFQEEKNAHELTRIHFDQTNAKYQQLHTDFETQSQNMHNMQAQYNECLFANATMDHLLVEKDTALQQALDHRDQVLRQMQESVRKQEELTKQWQAAEQACWLADSQRNFQFANHQLVLRKLSASVNDHLVTLERLHQAEEELLVLKNEFAEEIYELKQNELRKKRQARALGIVTAATPGGAGLGATEPPGSATSSTRDSTRFSVSSRNSCLVSLSPTRSPQNNVPPATAPAGSSESRRVSRNSFIPANSQRASTPGTGTSSRRSTSGTSSLLMKRQNYSLNAREYGNRLRLEETIKQTNRLEKLDTLRKESLEVSEAMQNGVVARAGTIAGIGIGSDHLISVASSQQMVQSHRPVGEPSDQELQRQQHQQMQQEFVLSLKTFATHRKKQWQEFQADRDKQSAFVESVLQRPIATAPNILPHRKYTRRTSKESDDHDPTTNVAAGDGTSDPPTKLTPLNVERPRSTLNFQVYRKYLPPQRPMTSPMELHMEPLAHVYTEPNDKPSISDQPHDSSPTTPSAVVS